jgi:saccharopine dehydrogenase-like NADP-dependent oxidoreductase
MVRGREKVMIIGIGELGGIILEYLCRVPNICEIVTADLDADWGLRKTNSAIEGASYLGLAPNIKFYPVDLLNIDMTAELLGKINPTIICNGTTL